LPVIVLVPTTVHGRVECPEDAGVADPVAVVDLAGPENRPVRVLLEGVVAEVDGALAER
jgi:hypothetical protein